MATSLDTLSLSQMLDLAIGMPQKGAIHFAALRKLLQAVLEHLDVQYLSSQEPWPGQLSGPSLADLATDMGKMKREMEDYKKHMSKVLREEIAGIKAENSRISEDMRKIQKSQSHMAGNMKKIQEMQDKDTTLIRDLHEEIDKIKTTQICMEGDIKKIKESLALMKKIGEDLKKLRQDAAKWKEESSKEISQQIEALRQETKRDLQKMGEQQEMRNAMLEQLVTETANKVNEQLGGTGETTVGLLEELEGENGDCSSCTFNIRAHLGKLLQRCEKLQEKVECLESRQMAMGKLKKMMRNWGQLEHDHERLRYMEATVVRMKGDCEKLSFVSGTLQKDSEQKQKAIEMLFQSLEKLQKEKTDEQDVLAAIDVKADKAALGSKVNCSQFEANMERLDERMQELQSRISDQEQHFNTMQQQLNLVVEEKLDRLELKTFSSQMEDSWSRNMEELENRLMRENAAGIKKQLPVPFTCLSCDRMLTVQVPGQSPRTLPYLQPLPPSKEPQHSQRRPVAHGSVPGVPPSSGDHQSSSSTMQNNKASPQRIGQPQDFLTVQKKPSVTQLLDRDGHISRGRIDQHPMAIRTQHASGPAVSREHRTSTAPRHISWAPGLVQPLQPRQTSTAPSQLGRTQRPVLDLGHLVRSEKRL
ncbi:glutamine-rich protein 2-like isoform X1 [Vidua chalybeata]|uniref:glutamine-rich protein 2-like isoform X1 n=1 Tax=Vidua chalybeata TaxID=81927 RepID=UPI0023A7BCE1|nr:glutamine-rich protein 2-like isoform X1 [Vidua chalybeata]